MAQRLLEQAWEVTEARQWQRPLLACGFLMAL